MAFTLSAQRDEDVVRAFGRYAAYLESVRDRLPRAVYDLASSDWYFRPTDHRCPHDAWLESVTISEPSSGERREVRSTSIRIRLLGAYHDGFIEFFYPKVFRYELAAQESARGHGDWLFDEFRLSEGGHVLHEIEWSGSGETVRWVIECSDVEYRWRPVE